MKNSLVKYIVTFSQNMLDLIMCLLLGLSYLFVRIVPIAVLTFWGTVGVMALCKASDDSEFINMPVGHIALIGVAATVLAIILEVAAITLLDNTTEDNADED